MREELINRLLKYSVAIYKLNKHLCKTYSGRHVYGQLFRSATSAGANYDEATAAESRKDFIHKMQVALKELRESRFWVRFISMSGIIPKDEPALMFIKQESIELLSIIGKAVSTAKKNIQQPS